MGFFKDGLGEQHPNKALSKDIDKLSSLERGMLILCAVLFFPLAAHRAMAPSLGSIIFIYALELSIILSSALAVLFKYLSIPDLKDVLSGASQNDFLNGLASLFILIAAIAIILGVIIYIYDLWRLIKCIDRKFQGW